MCLSKEISDVKILPGEECFTPHKLQVMGVELSKIIYLKSTAKRQIQWWKLKDKKAKKRMEERMEHCEESVLRNRQAFKGKNILVVE